MVVVAAITHGDHSSEGKEKDHAEDEELRGARRTKHAERLAEKDGGVDVAKPGRVLS